MFMSFINIAIVLSFTFYIVQCLTKINHNHIIYYHGRFHYDTIKSLYIANWPNSGYTFYIENDLNDNINIEMKFLMNDSDYHYYINVNINCQFYNKYEISSNNSYININMENTSIHNSVYMFDIHKLTESSYSNAKGLMALEYMIIHNGNTITKENAFNNNQLIASCNINKYKMLIIGDSITAAYGVDGTSPCTFDASLEDVSHGYGTIVANEIHADLHTIAWSGKGVVRNYGDINQLSIDPMPLYYNRTISTIPVSSNISDEYYWNPSIYPADVVIVMLGSNDYSTTPYPNDNDFVNGLVQLLEQIKLDYPNAINHIAAMCAPSQHDNQCMNIEKATIITNNTYIYIDPNIYEGGYGCDDHPNKISQQNIANIVIPAIKKLLE